VGKSSYSARKEGQASIKSATKNQNTKYIWGALVALVIIFLLLMAPSFIKGWWSDVASLFSETDSKLSTQPAATATPHSTVTEETTSSTSDSGSSNGTNGAAGTNGSNGSNGSNGTPSNPDSKTLVEVVDQVANGDTKDDILANIQDVDPVCTANVIQIVTLQEVCTFTQDGHILTLTFQNGRTVNVIKSGF
jgi:hypothetical protein